MPFLMVLLFALGPAHARSIEEISLPCVRVFELNDAPDLAKRGILERTLDWNRFANGGLALGRDLRAEFVKIDDEVAAGSPSLRLYRDNVEYKLFLQANFRVGDYVNYDNPFVHGFSDTDPLKPLLKGKFNVYLRDDVSFIISEDKSRLAVCPQATMDWNEVRPALFRFLGAPQVARHVTCGKFLSPAPSKR